MSRRRREIAERICRAKTARRNVYASAELGALAVVRIQRNNTDVGARRLKAFHCPVCDQWHIGKRPCKRGGDS